MLFYCLKIKKNTESKKLNVEKIKFRRIMLFGSTKLRFIKEQEASDFLTDLLGIKSPFGGIPIVGNII